jgi:hypothetical protein
MFGKGDIEELDENLFSTNQLTNFDGAILNQLVRERPKALEVKDSDNSAPDISATA